MPTSRERVLAALNHVEIDSVPIDRGSHASSTIAVTAYMKLRSHLNLDQDESPKMYNTWENIAMFRSRSSTIWAAT